ncbi:hypothetical protein AOQ84DRAFT_288983 [Glonium stellatum]|uniref:CorA-like transporter domain-containing protein n=1 Tax=Glonium stellatum TaxID=574774 RepID=A0A8E2F4T4_9PEZI|nr:hypothetical protein AOQ84DRAFT_288983 [Glonium stellatum]
MLLCALTYYQVMPAFLDFLFPFGQQKYQKDFHSTGFRHETRLSEIDRGLALPNLGRSGRSLQLCYSLKSVEPSKTGNGDWTIRQTALYHSFDMESGQAVWFIVKASQMMKKRIRESSSSPELASFENLSRSFASTFGVHLILCDWARENWRWYINSLEDRLQERTEDTLLAPVGKISPAPFLGPQRITTAPPTGPIQHQSSSLVSGGIPLQRLVRRVTGSLKPGRSATLPPDTTSTSMHIPTCSAQIAAIDPEDYTFKDLQQLQFDEEKANEALLILKMNANILLELNEYYQSLWSSEDPPDDLRNGCKGDMARFQRRVAGVISDLRMQQSRIEMLLQLAADRKNLLYSIFEHRNMQTNKELAQKAQMSAEKMEVLTEQMNEIAIKTERETVSMRIVTLVTLFFLPGTFVSTLMSTSVFQFDSGTKLVESKALHLFLALCLPLMALTFISAWIYFKVENRRDRSRWGRFPLKIPSNPFHSLRPETV